MIAYIAIGIVAVIALIAIFGPKPPITLHEAQALNIEQRSLHDNIATSKKAMLVTAVLIEPGMYVRVDGNVRKIEKNSVMAITSGSQRNMFEFTSGERMAIDALCKVEVLPKRLAVMA